MLSEIKDRLQSFANQEKILMAKKFFKTSEGQYGEGDIFIGVTIPEIRIIVKEFLQNISFEDIENLLQSKIHEERMLAILFLVEQFEYVKDKNAKEEIINFYLTENNLKQINNWDLVDISCYKILGKYLLQNPEKINILYDFVKSNNLWKRRIAIITTFSFIKDNKFEHTINLSVILLQDKHNLINKATGWMLREMGKRNKQVLLDFLTQYANIMPRVTLSYATEKLTDEEKKFYRCLK